MPVADSAHQQASPLRSQYAEILSSNVSLCPQCLEGLVSPLEAQQCLSTYSTSLEPGPPMLSPLILQQPLNLPSSASLFTGEKNWL